MKILVIAPPDMLPEELATNPDVVVIDPATMPEEMLAALDDVAGGMLGDADAEGGEGALTDWAGEEEREHGMGGYGDDEEAKADKDASGEGEGDEEDLGGEGDEDEDKKKGASGSRGRGGRGRFDSRASGRGAMPALSRWASAMGRGR